MHEYAVEVSLSLLELHLKDLVHGDVDLKNVLCSLIHKEAHQPGFIHKFKLTNLKPWVVDSFPSDEHDNKLI